MAATALTLGLMGGTLAAATTANADQAAGPASTAQSSVGPAAAKSLDPTLQAGPPGSGIDRDQQTSDGVRGTLAKAILPGLVGKVVRTNERSWTMAPGLTYEQWDRTDARGTMRAYLMRLDYTAPNLRVDYAWPGVVRRTKPLSSLLNRADGIAGVNGDFFDIADTGAPLGIGRARGTTVNGRAKGWNASFYLTPGGTPKIGELPLKAKIKQRPSVPISYYNSPTVLDNSIGVYDNRWRWTAGARVTDGVTGNVRQVVIRGNKVISNRKKLDNKTKIKRGVILVGRGSGARRLQWLRPGDKAQVVRRIYSSPQIAISGNRALLRDRKRVVVDDKEMHPRTAIGIDRDNQTLLFLVIDGRQSFSRGATMVELAKIMLAQGAEDALNLDGGGSSTMIGPASNGVRRVLNSPSDGRQRHVPNGLAITPTGQPPAAPTPAPSPTPAP